MYSKIYLGDSTKFYYDLPQSLEQSQAPAQNEPQSVQQHTSQYQPSLDADGFPILPQPDFESLRVDDELPEMLPDGRQ